MDGSYLTILFRWGVKSFNFYLFLSTEFLFGWGDCNFENCFFLCEGGGYCCFFGSGVCLLCVLCSFCWEEDVSVHCYGPLHTPGNSIFHLYLIFATHFTDFEMRSVIVAF